MNDTSPPARPPESLAAGDPRVYALRRLLGIVDRLREPDGCPWDKKQTVASMAPHVVEEAHELAEAVAAGGTDEITEEAGDVMMALALLCRIGQQDGAFDLARAAEVVSEKLVRRHPHVFGDLDAESADAVLANWEAIKKQERQDKDADSSALAGVPRTLPALQRAARMCGKARHAGFRWNDVEGAFAKVREELAELEEALPGDARTATDKAALTGALTGETRARVEHELGDLLLATAFLGQYLELDPERLAKDALRRFESRFRDTERRLGGSMHDRPLEELMDAWQRAKDAE